MMLLERIWENLRKKRRSLCLLLRAGEDQLSAALSVDRPAVRLF